MTFGQGLINHLIIGVGVASAVYFASQHSKNSNKNILGAPSGLSGYDWDNLKVTSDGDYCTYNAKGLVLCVDREDGNDEESLLLQQLKLKAEEKMANVAHKPSYNAEFMAEPIKRATQPGAFEMYPDSGITYYVKNKKRYYSTITGLHPVDQTMIFDLVIMGIFVTIVSVFILDEVFVGELS